jgi:hypothetical protein
MADLRVWGRPRPQDYRLALTNYDTRNKLPTHKLTGPAVVVGGDHQEMQQRT